MSAAGNLMGRRLGKKLTKEWGGTIGYSNTGSSSTTKTITGVALGTPRSDRLIVLPLIWIVNQPALVSATITDNVTGTPIAMSIVVQKQQTSFSAAILKAKVPSGTTASVTLTFASGTIVVAGTAFALTRMQSEAAYASASNGGNSDSTRTLTLNIPAHGIAIAVANGQNLPVNWTGIDVEVWENTVLIDTNAVAFAYKLTDTALTGHSISAGSGIREVVAASFH